MSFSYSYHANQKKTVGLKGISWRESVGGEWSRYRWEVCRKGVCNNVEFARIFGFISRRWVKESYYCRCTVCIGRNLYVRFSVLTKKG
jgi:hypothetical protein